MKSGFVSVILGNLVVLAFSQSAKESPVFIGAGNLTLGTHEPGESVIQDVTIRKPFEFGKAIRPFHFEENYWRITCIELVDISGTESGAASYEIYGGVGCDWITIDFTSQPFRGIYYTVKVYADTRNGFGRFDED